jgi:hypothetical protein
MVISMDGWTRVKKSSGRVPITDCDFDPTNVIEVLSPLRIPSQPTMETLGILQQSNISTQLQLTSLMKRSAAKQAFGMAQPNALYVRMPL